MYVYVRSYYNSITMSLYIFQIGSCTLDDMRDGWNVNDIPINETNFNVTVLYDDKSDHSKKFYHDSTTCSFSG